MTEVNRGLFKRNQSGRCKTGNSIKQNHGPDCEGGDLLNNPRAFQKLIGYLSDTGVGNIWSYYKTRYFLRNYHDKLIYECSKNMSFRCCPSNFTILEGFARARNSPQRSWTVGHRSINRCRLGRLK